MRELLQTIGTAEIRDITQLDLLCNIVKEYYTNNKRHKYSEVSAYLMETDDIEYLLENLRCAREQKAGKGLSQRQPLFKPYGNP